MTTTLYNSSLPPIKNATWTFDVVLFDSDGAIKGDPTLAAGDIVIYKDGVLDGNIDTLPADIGSSGIIPVALSADEMNANRVAVWFHDAAGDEWEDLLVTFRTVQAATVAGDLLSEATDGYASGTVGAALNRLGSGQIVTTSIVAQSGAVTTVQGDDYEADDGRAIDWTDSSNIWPTLTSATVSVVIDSVDTFAGSVVTATGDSKKVRLELTDTESALIDEGSHVYQVIATLTSGRIVTLVEGAWISKRRFAE